MIITNPEGEFIEQKQERNKIIKGVMSCFHGQECCGNKECPYWIQHEDWDMNCVLDECQENLQRDLLCLLKTIEPVAPIWRDNKAYCGNCGCRVPAKIKGRYCHKCGTKINWNEDKTNG